MFVCFLKRAELSISFSTSNQFDIIGKWLHASSQAMFKNKKLLTPTTHTLPAQPTAVTCGFLWGGLYV